MPYNGQAAGTPYDIYPRMLEDPIVLTGSGKLYAKLVTGVVQLYFQSDDGTVHQITPLPAAAEVLSVFGRTGAVVAEADDYSTDLILNDSTVFGAYLTQALDVLKNVTDSLITDVNGKAPAALGIPATVVASQNADPAWVNSLVQCSHAAGLTITVQSGTYTAGQSVVFQQIGAGAITFAAGGGVTIESRGSLMLSAGEDAICTLICKNAGTLFVLAGDRA